MATKTASLARALARASVFLATASFLLAGCASGTSSGSVKAGVGVDTSAKTITLGVLTPLTTAVGTLIGVPLTHGVETYFDYLNDNGGITVGSDHYKVKLLEEDSKYNVATHVQGYNDIHNKVAMIAESLGSPTTAAITQLANTDKLLVSAATLDSGLARQPYMVMVGTPYRLQVENAFDYVVNQVGDKTAPVAIIYQNDPYGQDGLAGYQEAKTAYKLNDVDQQNFVYNAAGSDVTAQVVHLKATGAKYVFVSATPSDALKIIGTGAQLGYTPQWIWQSPCFASFQLALAPSLVPLMEHNVWVVAGGASWGDTSKPGMALMLQNVAKYMPAQKPDGFFQFGYTESIITAAILQKAASNGDLTRDGLFNAFNSLSDVDLGELLPDAHYGPTPNQRVPSRDNIIYAIDHTAVGDVKPISNDFVGTAAAASSF